MNKKNKYSISHIEGVGDFYIDEVDDIIKNELRNGRVWEPYIIQALMKYIVPGTTVVDVGAHIGTHTIKMSKCVGERGEVIAFEPQRKIFSELVKNLNLNNCKNTKRFRFAIGDVNGKTVEMNPTNQLNEGATSIGSGGDSVKMRSLDSMKLSNVSLIKIDVEGSEYSALKGAEETILRDKPTIIFECWIGESYEKSSPIQKMNFDRVLSLMESYRYETYIIQGCDFIAFPGDEKSEESSLKLLFKGGVLCAFKSRVLTP